MEEAQKAFDRIFVSIAVGKPNGLAHLPGAYVSAGRIAAWARAHDYLVIEVSDEGAPVTVELLRDKISDAIALVKSESELKRFVIHFAGHGAALAVGDQYWLLSHWDVRPTEAISVLALQRMLEYYGPRQVAVIGDACQEFSSTFIDLRGHPILDRPEEEPRRFELDQFLAVDVGKQAFMIKGTDGKRDFCLFTEVLLDALEGDADQPAFEHIGVDRVVTSQSIARHLDVHVPRAAGKYRVRMIPLPRPGFYTDRVYSKLPQPDLAAHKTDSRSGEKIELAASKTSRADLLLEKDLHQVKVDRLAQYKKQLHTVGADGFSSIVYAPEATAIAVNPAQAQMVKDRYERWHGIEFLSEGTEGAWTDVLIRMGDGCVLSACALRGFLTHVQVLRDGAVIVSHQPINTDGWEQVSPGLELQVRLQVGLPSDALIVKAAGLLRASSHPLPMLGCVVAQLYDTVRDVDSLRSLAAHFASANQPVPLDIILLGGGTLHEVNERLFADIPATPEKLATGNDLATPRFSDSATPAYPMHPVAGRVPWLRATWSALETAQVATSSASWLAFAEHARSDLVPGESSTFADEMWVQYLAGTPFLQTLRGEVRELDSGEQSA